MTSLNPVKRIGEQIAPVLRLKLGLGRHAALARALDLLGDVAIRDPSRVLAAYPHELSGGMRQRVLIAIAFSCKPRLVVADEPTTALDVTVQRQILRLIHDLQHKAGAAVLFVTHDLGLVAKLCQTVTVLHAGRVVEDGVTRDVLSRPAHAYTQALLGATPRLDRPADALAPLAQDAGRAARRGGPHLRSRQPGQLPVTGPLVSLRRLKVALPDRSRKPLFGEAPLIEIVKGIDLDIRRGGAVGLVGEFGIGQDHNRPDAGPPAPPDRRRAPL